MEAAIAPANFDYSLSDLCRTSSQCFYGADVAWVRQVTSSVRRGSITTLSRCGNPTRVQMLLAFQAKLPSIRQ